MTDQQFSTIVGLLTEIRDAIKTRAAHSSASSNTQPERSQSGTSYAKLKSGDWGIRSPVSLASGQKVEVTTRTGKVKHETVVAVVHQGQDRQSGKKYFLCSIVQRGKPENASAPVSAEAEAQVSQPAEEEDDVPF